MRKTKLGLTAVAVLMASTFSAAPAMADIVQVDASSIQGENVLFNGGTQTGTTVTGQTNTGSRIINFTGSTVGGATFISANGGQARIEGAANVSTSNPNDSLLVQGLNFQLADLFGSTRYAFISPFRKYGRGGYQSIDSANRLRGV